MRLWSEKCRGRESELIHCSIRIEPQLPAVEGNRRGAGVEQLDPIRIPVAIFLDWQAGVNGQNLIDDGHRRRGTGRQGTGSRSDLPPTAAQGRPEHTARADQVRVTISVQVATGDKLSRWHVNRECWRKRSIG